MKSFFCLLFCRNRCFTLRLFLGWAKFNYINGVGCKSQFFKYRHGQLWLSQRLWLLPNSKIDHFLVVNRVQWYQLQPVLSRSSLRGFLVSLTPAVFVTHRYGAEYSSFERQLAVYSIRGGSEGKGVEAVALPIFFFFCGGAQPPHFWL